jgi:ZIP family zinc transporter
VNAILLSLVAFCSTLAGGLFALRFRDRLPLVLGFAAGALLGIVCFELLPESFEGSRRLGGGGEAALLALVCGFLACHGLRKFVRPRAAHGEGYAHHHDPRAGVLSAAALVGHSFMDGAGIGLAFQVSPSVGFTVAIAVIAHDFCDGLTTVSVMLMHRNTAGHTLAMLVMGAAAPVLGAASTLAFHVPAEALVLYLGFFAGFLFYVGAFDILPHAMRAAG